MTRCKFYLLSFVSWDFSIKLLLKNAWVGPVRAQLA